VVVSHGCFLHFLTNDWVNAVNSDGGLLPSHFPPSHANPYCKATDWANAEVRSFAFAHDEDERSALRETLESRKNRGLGPVALTKEQQLELQQATLKMWIEWGVILA
jgi:hypothetical protein